MNHEGNSVVRLAEPAEAAEVDVRGHFRTVGDVEVPAPHVRMPFLVQKVPVILPPRTLPLLHAQAWR